MSIFIEIFPASYGDCFLVSLESENSEPFNILIDGGFESNPYQTTLKSRLISMKGQGKQIDLLIVTHIDTDHINGIVALLRDNENDTIIPIKEIWFNGYRHFHHWKKATEQLSSDQKRYLTSIIDKGIPEEEGISKDNTEIGGKQGLSLTELIVDRKIPWNTHFQGNAVVTDSVRTVPLREDIKLTLLTPTTTILDELDKKWRKDLGSEFKEIDNPILTKAVEYLIAQIEREIKSKSQEISASSKELSAYLEESFEEDTEIPNKSSIAFILEFENKKLLFLGDSHPSDVKASLEKWNKETTKHFFNLIKVSHHGSSGNTSPELLSLIDSNRFIISTNGGSKSNHPDLDCLARIVCRPIQEGSERTLIFNYATTSAYKAMLNSAWQEKHKYRIEPIIDNQIITIEI